MIRFTVHGKAQAAGSKRHVGRGIIVDANKNAKPWQAEVKAAALDVFQGPLIEGPVAIEIREYRLRPKGHFRTTGELSAAGLRKPFPTSAPDTGKIARGIHDALTGIVYRDDAQIVLDVTSKEWGESERTEVEIQEFVTVAFRTGDLQVLASRVAG